MLPVCLAKKLNFAMNKFYWSLNFSRACAYLTSYWTMDWPPAGPCSTDHNPFNSAVQPVFNPPHLISSPHIITFSMKMLYQRVLKTETFIKAEANNTHCSTCIHQASNFVTKGYYIDEAWFQVSKPMLIVSNNPHVLNKFGNGFQSYMFHPLPWDRGGANQPILLQILLAFPAVKSDLSFFCSSGMSPDYSDNSNVIHRTTEWIRFEGTTVGCLVQPCCWSRVILENMVQN